MGLITELYALQDSRGFLASEDLKELARKLKVPLYRLEGLISFYPHFRRTPPQPATVHLCRDMSCHLAAPGWCKRAKERLEGLPDIEVHEASCLGRCEQAPAATINDVPIAGADLDRLVALAMHPEQLPPDEPTANPRKWQMDPYESRVERYGIASSMLASGADAADRIIKLLKDSGLRGMGGAGFPTGLKWELVRKEKAGPKVVVVNADESEPGTFKDRVILEELPHLVIEGTLIAGRVIGAERGIVYIRHEYTRERKALAREIERARKSGVLGKNAAGTGKNFDIEIFVSPGGYILGEETALLQALEDERGEPRNKPPFPGTKGLFGKPTLINNVETLAMVPRILDDGVEGWKARGRPGYAGLKMIALSGDVARPDVYEIATGTTVRELIEMAGGMKDKKPLKGFAPGGASSNFLSASAVDVPLDFGALQKAGSMLGSGAVLVVAEGTDTIDLAANIVAFFKNESCGKCVPCRVGSQKAVTILERLLAGQATQAEVDLLTPLNETLLQTSICGLGQVAIAPALSAFKAFPEDLKRHLA